MQAQIGRRKVWLATLANSIFPGIAAGFAVYFWDRSRPGYVHTYWVVYCAVAVLSAIGMWYVPYLRGAPEKIKREYLAMYAGTATSCRRAATIPAPISSIWGFTHSPPNLQPGPHPAFPPARISHRPAMTAKNFLSLLRRAQR